MIHMHKETIWSGK